MQSARQSVVVRRKLWRRKALGYSAVGGGPASDAKAGKTAGETGWAAANLTVRVDVGGGRPTVEGERRRTYAPTRSRKGAEAQRKATMGNQGNGGLTRLSGFAALWLRAGALFLMALAGGAVAGTNDAKPTADPVQAELDRVKGMSVAEQQTWLAQLEQRAARAAQLTLSVEDAAKLQARTQSLLHQKTVTWEVLREVLADTMAREKAKEKTAKPVDKTDATKPQAAAATSEKLPPGSVKVDVAELDARIGGSNLALRELETALAEKDVVWNAAKLEPILDRLKMLAVRYDDLSLFRRAVPKKERATVTQLESPKSAITQLSARVVEARNLANDPKFAGDDVERQAELTRLEAISHRLAELGGK
jgi:hypothetical protein